MRTVLFTDHTSVVGGGELCLLDLLAGLPDEINAVVACPEGDLADRVRGLGIAVAIIRGTTGSLKLSLRTPVAFAEIVANGVAVWRIARRRRADLIHANSLRSGLMGCVTRVLPRSPPSVVHIHDCLPGGWASAVVRALLRRGLDGFLANSRYSAERFAPDAPGTLPVVYNPIDLRRFDPGHRTSAEARRLVGLPADVPLLGVVAQLTPWKGQIDAIRALALVREDFPETTLVIAGGLKFLSKETRYDNRAFLDELNAEVARLGLEAHVLFLGDRADVPELVQALDVLLMPSWEEPFGRIAVEAMSMGTAVVATQIGGPAEFIAHGRTGLLVAPRNAAALAGAVRRLLADPDDRERIANAGKAFVRERFCRARYVNEVVEAYDVMVSE